MDLGETPVEAGVRETLEEVGYFKIEELKELDNEGFKWVDALKKFI